MVDIDREHKPHRSTIIATDGENRRIPEKSDGMDSRCINNSEETMNGMGTLLDQQAKVTKDPEDVEVDVTTHKDINETRLPEAEDPGATEYSSSFVDTISDTEKCSGLSEAEVESQFFSDSDLASPYGGFSGTFQSRKKLTNHWRSYIRPIMWRCKWAELRIREMESQALQDAREITACEQRKYPGNYDSTFEGFCSKLLPFSNHCYRRRAQKRRKRKRVEDTTDKTLYMSHHILFSYLENKRSNPNGTSIPDDFGERAIKNQHADCNGKLGLEDDELLYEIEDGNDSLESVLREIEVVHSRVHKLKNLLDMVISKNAAKFSSSENLSLLAPCDAQTSSAPSPTFSAGNGEAVSLGPIYTATPHSSGCIFGDLVIPESAMSSYGEAIHVPDIIESTVGLLSAADVTFHQSQIGDSSEDIVDNVLIHNEAADRETGLLMGTSIQLMGKHQEQEQGEEESTNPCPVPTSEPDPITKNVAPQEQLALKSCLASDLQFPRNKRTRGERKTGSVGWSKQCSGVPDSQ